MRILYAAAVLMALWGCESKSTKPATTVATPAADTTHAAPALGSYEGSIAGKYPFRLAITNRLNKSEVVGIYYYLKQQKPIRLWGILAPDGEIWLREIDPERPDTVAAGWGPGGKSRYPFAYFRLRHLPQGGLAGTWQAAKSDKLLPVQLTPYQASSPVQKAHASERTYFEEFTAPEFTVADMAVTEKLYWLFDIEDLSEQTLEDLQEEHRSHKNGGFQGYGGITSEVTYNDRGLLSVSLRDEYTAANVNSRFWTKVVDLHTGEELSESEIDPAKRQAFLAACEVQLQQQISEYISNSGEELDSTDIAGLRSQHIGTGNALGDMQIAKNDVSFNHSVEYDMMSNFIRKMYAEQFRVSFTFAEMARYLKPNSPLRRLL
ncbi:hypothetical protein [Hymenobacter wooponensis]|uniref:Uncharacterized protein n=1 Tax=Hymenobacter wooponensis TaxID=1525360 RepID=A0A4Z0MPW3_9BACT|nr:hypothetical protein [Hymenobacter wooponensis]TGD81306.1 hypothetical protein EU557_06990 [Hymenobacter wooponensis]